ncbi:uncharacterized protein si:ch211-196f5.2 [Triplophysa rosa]|uniref:Uncharacterized protein n=1 Tax=Triplophysa rosa TaxID=992332 RepID=A0A9W7W9T9_TRIRA|nr:uncharacterized protein si:ch211-196f5.2 [Triplophysa rosa]KAI7792857.1 hypothetical protein IRJ41_019244 [Triplophysa rosa]
MIIDKDKERLPVNADSTVKLAGLGKDSEVQQKARPQETQVNSNTEEDPSDHPANDKMVRAELEWSVPMCVPLPIEVLNHDQAFPFLNTTLADLGIEESAVKERVVWVDTKHTRVKGRTGKLKEKEVTVLEVRVKAQHPGEPQSREVIYSTESHTDRSFCRSGVDVLPWRHTQPAENEHQPVEMILAVDTLSESKPKWQKTEEKWDFQNEV